jgi:uncharacterized membrane protein YhaH (DUF805 family)
MRWYLATLRKYATFSGRARRSEYWYFVLFYMLFVFVLSFVDSVLGTYDASAGIGLLSGLFVLSMLLPAIAVGVRRLHDIGRTGWWLLVSFVPVAGFILLLVFTVRDSDPGDNAYGPNPKGAAA